MYVKFYETLVPKVKELTKSPSRGTVYSLLESTASNRKSAETTPAKKTSKLKSVTSNTPKSERRKRESDSDGSTPRSSKSAAGRTPTSVSKSAKENSIPVATDARDPAEPLNLNAW